ncbi:DedD protein [Microbulbifer donghaiensis]|uniref:DedD protein n=1 Tax=Microbulbifer donghaiensis TaxID=494016 RepID=A0A1M4X8J7_9GAMM|nr:SPOR domain-containing protein [Microbulbifer donghaiensis]SHE89804.1 DedD protein [Microbulbifer donghaiensis]
MASREYNPPRGGRLNDGFKQRIVGALVLAALAVIFLPSLFDREGARYIDVTSQIPPAPDIQPIEIAAPEPVAGVAPAPAPGDAFQPEVPEQFSNPKAENVDTVAEAPVEAEPAAVEQPQTEKPESAPVLDAQGLPIAWVVQVASYRDEARANQLRARLMDKGYKAYTRSVTTSKGQFVRVFVGPNVSKADAQAVKRELDQLLKAQTLVLRFKA